MPAAGSSWITNLLKLLLVIDSTGLVLTLTFICFRVLKVRNFPSLFVFPPPLPCMRIWTHQACTLQDSWTLQY